jgi:hypothetical protein
MQEIIDVIPPEKARLAFEEMRPLLDAQIELRRLTTGLDRAAIFGASTGRMVQQPEVLSRFALLPAAEFDIQHVLRLESAALAAWYVSLMLRSASVTAGVKIPENVIEQGTLLKQVMLKVLEYNLGHDADLITALTDIRQGNGYVDLASDLVRLGTLYQAHAADLATDVRHYRAEHAETAGRLAQAIHQVLGDGRDPSARYWNNYMPRAWSFLVITYDEVSAAGRWLFRHEDGDERFPSLYAVGRQRRSRRPDDSDQGDEGEVIPGDGIPDGDVIAEPAISQG